ncbi:MAG: hypothetical protein HC831_21985 [Chloroflexia bacterium]|nr:hypothetical protein [Chloroflexia bacterium]
MTKILELEWKKYDGTPILNVADYVKEWVEKWPDGEIMIGCDSQAHSRYIKYSISINMHMVDRYGGGHGGHVIFANVIDTSKSMKNDLYTKLWAEAEYSVRAAQDMDAENLGVRIVIHLDYNSNPEKYSNVLYNGGLGYVKGMFNGNVEVFGKPDAWAASCSSDAICKNKQAKGIK